MRGPRTLQAIARDKIGFKGVTRQGYQPSRRYTKKDQNSMLGFRPMLLIGLIASLVVIATYGAHAGICPDPALRDEASSARLVTLTASKSEERPTGHIWSATRSESRLRLRGSVPSEEDQRTLLGMVKALFPDLEVEDRMKIVDNGTPTEQWLGAVSFGLQQLAHLKRGSVRLFKSRLGISGEASSAEDFVEIKKALVGPLPTGLTIKGENVRPPIADPFVFTADLGTNALSLAGSVPSEEARKQLRELARELFERPGLDDRLELASGAPEGWDEAAIAALRALSSLESGKVSLSGRAVTIEGVAPDQGTAVAVSYQLRRDLPKPFSTSESIKWKEASAPGDVASEVIPRIKAYARTNANGPKSVLPALMPPLGAR